MPNTTTTPLDHLIEAILFTATEALSAGQLAKITGASAPEVIAALATLGARLTGGIQLAAAGRTYRLVTSPETAEVVGPFIADTSRQELSRPALETLAIIAYKGPLTRAAIESIRGVASEAMLRNLTNRGLIEQAGHSSEPGRPPLYGVTHSFLQQFGITDQSGLPPLPEDDVAAIETAEDGS